MTTKSAAETTHAFVAGDSMAPHLCAATVMNGGAGGRFAGYCNLPASNPVHTAEPTTDEATPRPWRLAPIREGDYVGKFRQILDANGNTIVGEFDGPTYEQADLIVRAGNAFNLQRDAAFEALVKAGEWLAETAALHSWAHIENAECGCKQCAIRAMRDALALAEGNQ